MEKAQNNHLFNITAVIIAFLLILAAWGNAWALLVFSMVAVFYLVLQHPPSIANKWSTILIGLLVASAAVVIISRL